jgi:hypothetical protein
MKLTTSFRSADLGRKAAAPRASTPCASVLLPVPESTTMRACGKAQAEFGQAAQAVRVGQCQVEQHEADAGLVGFVQGQRIGDVAGLEDLDVRAGRRGLRLHQRADAQAQQVVVVHDQDRGGRGRARRPPRPVTGVRVRESMEGATRLILAA